VDNLGITVNGEAFGEWLILARAKRLAPADPQAIAAERVRSRAQANESSHRARMHGLRTIAERELERESKLRGSAEERQGIGDEIRSPRLAASKGVDVRTGKDGARQRVLSAERADPFTNIWRAGGIDTGQFSAAQRLLRDVMLANGVREAETWRADPRPDAGLRGELVSQPMIDAGRRVADALATVGIRDRRVLEAFARAMARGDAPPWRALVEAETGVTEKHRQGQVIEDVIENLRLGYDALDRKAAAERRKRLQAANDSFPANDP
jgi:hypothetical protein